MKPEKMEVKMLRKYLEEDLHGPTRLCELETEAEKLVKYLKSQGVEIIDKGAPCEHVGRVIVDAVMQVNHDYEKYVRPRVRYITKQYPEEAATVSGLLHLIDSVGAAALLTNDRTNKPWNGKKEQTRLYKHALFFYTRERETFSDLHDWLQSKWQSSSPEENRDSLTELDGVANKTADYYRVLAGHADAVKVDSRVEGFLADAGVSIGKYEYKELRTIVQMAAMQMGVRPLDLDYSIWHYCDKNKSRKGREIGRRKNREAKKMNEEQAGGKTGGEESDWLPVDCAHDFAVSRGLEKEANQIKQFEQTHDHTYANEREYRRALYMKLFQFRCLWAEFLQDCWSSPSIKAYKKYDGRAKEIFQRYPEIRGFLIG